MIGKLTASIGIGRLDTDVRVGLGVIVTTYVSALNTWARIRIAIIHSRIPNFHTLNKINLSFSVVNLSSMKLVQSTLEQKIKFFSVSVRRPVGNEKVDRFLGAFLRWR